jgi:hypothetical protein
MCARQCPVPCLFCTDLLSNIDFAQRTCVVECTDYQACDSKAVRTS